MRAIIDGLSQHFVVRGAGRPVLFVHGFPLSGELWTPTVERLQEIRAIVPDLRGHGASEPGAEAGMDRLAQDLELLLDHLQVTEPVAVVGLSMGGYAALELCRRSPERVGSLVLVDTRAEPDTDEAARGRLELAERVLREGSGVVADALVAKLFAAAAPAGLRERWRRIMAATPPAGAAAALRGMARRPGSLPTLRSARWPVLIVVGEEDSITPMDAAQRMHEAAPHSRLVVVSGAGHMTPVEQPERFAAVLQEFLAAD